MFYHSQEPRHLHYHPLEAMVAGQPVVFMSGGLLERLGGPQQTGMCTTYAEAREKIGRLLDGDVQLRSAILRDRVRIRDVFTDENCTKIWQENFVPIATGESQ